MGGAGRWQRNATGDPPQALPQRRLLSVDYSRLHPCGRAGVEGRSGFLSRRNVGTGNLGSKRLLAILNGRTAHVAAGMRRSATLHRLDEPARQRIDSCADYLLKYKKNMQYDQYLKMGLPIATGVIEGACRYLVQDRMDRTGARWSLNGAEAVLRLRALRTSGDFDAYWRFHEEQEYLRNHVALYAGGQVAPIRSRAKKHLKRIK